MNKLALFASGSGSNAQRIAEYFANHPEVEISCILSNRTDAYVLERARMLGIPSVCFSRDDLYASDKVLRILQDYSVNFIVLAGFLWKVPSLLLEAYPNRILNIHPALLPKYGGKGMYGDHVHRAVVENRESETGITIHKVNDFYDEGEILFQARCEVLPSDTPMQVAEKVHALEYRWFPEIIERYLSEQMVNEKQW